MLIQVETNHEKFSALLRELDDLLKTTEQHDDATSARSAHEQLLGFDHVRA